MLTDDKSKEVYVRIFGNLIDNDAGTARAHLTILWGKRTRMLDIEELEVVDTLDIANYFVNNVNEKYEDHGITVEEVHEICEKMRKKRIRAIERGVKKPYVYG